MARVETDYCNVHYRLSQKDGGRESRKDERDTRQDEGQSARRGSRAIMSANGHGGRPQAKNVNTKTGSARVVFKNYDFKIFY